MRLKGMVEVRAMFVRAVRAIPGVGVLVSLATLSLATLLARPKSFFGDNFLPLDDRVWLAVVAVGCALVAMAWALVAIARGGETSLAALEWWVRVAGPLAVLPVFLALSSQTFGGDVEAALVLTFAALALERLCRVSQTAWAERPWAAPGRTLPAWLTHSRTALAVVLVLTCAQATLMTLWSVWAHQRFGTFGFDLGQYDSVFASTLHGRPLAMPPLRLTENWSDLIGNHADLGTFFLLPIYAVFPSAQTLLVLQALFCAGAAVPLYLFAKRRLSQGAAVVVAVAWLAYAPMHSAQLYDFHWQLVAAALVVCAVAALEYRRMVPYWVFFTLAILCREDVSIGLTALGLYLVFSGERPKTGVATALLAAVYFVVVRFVVMRGNSFFASIYKDVQAPYTGGFGAVLLTLLTNPAYVLTTLLSWDKVRYTAQIFAPLVFLPVRRAWLWLLLIPGFFLTLLSTGYWPTIQISFQYVGNWAAYLFPAAVLALAAYGSTREGLVNRRAALFAMLLASLVAAVRWGAYSPRGSIRGGFHEVPLRPPSESDRQAKSDLLALMEQVPADVALCTSERIQAHTTSLHVENYALRQGAHGCEFLLWSALPGDSGAEKGHEALGNRSFELVERRGVMTLAKRRH